MNYNTLLSRQVSRCLSADLRQHPEVIKLLATVNNSYKCFEKDIALSKSAFMITEKDCSDMNAQLRREVEEKRKSIHQLKETVYLIGEEEMEENSDDLLAISSYLNQQVKKRKQTEKFLSTLITNLHKGILLEDSGGRVLYSNQSFCNMFGFTEKPEDLTGKGFRIIIDQRIEANFSEPEKFRLEIAGILQNQEAVTNYRLELADGRIYEQAYIPIYIDDEFLGHLWNYTDITAQKKVEDEIVNQRKFTQDILNNLPADVAVFDNQHNYIFINPQASKDAEMRKWLIGKNDFDYCRRRGLDESTAIYRRAKFIEAIESRDNLSWTDEHKTKDGQVVHVLRKFHPYFENGELKFVIGYGVDVSSLKASEINLQKAFEVAEKTNKRLEQFAFAASHDLQEPLRMVTNYLALIEKKYKTVLDDTGKKYIHFAVDGALRMRQIILDLLEFSRIGRTEVKRGAVNLNELINEILVLFSSQIQEKGAVIHIGELPVLNTFKVPLRQAFQNLIGNALKYQKVGNAPKITISAKEDNTHWQFSVKDNGIGINQEHFERIFVIFQRLHVKEEYSGTGVGLAITQKIIESVGGKIWVESTEGEGSSFIFTIPKVL